ncbi:MAG: DUF554 domain-containing protein [Clostridiaceae bacterium]|nr:DUF554 domain-containing protein [Clostridia bacterium]MDY3871238.1 DUF554 domain-containing protein [Clostridiaceae bacterium]
MIGLGTLINVAAIVVGGGIGLAGGKRLSSRAQQTLIRGMAVCVLFVAIGGVMEEMLVVENGALRTRGTLMLVVSIALGGLMGELLDLDRRLEGFGRWLREKSGNGRDSRFLDGFITATMTVSIGAMAIVGAVEDGIHGDYTILAAKSLMDFVIILVMASSLGKGCLFSAIPVGLLQGSVTLLARLVQPLLTPAALSALALVGSALIFCVGLNLLWEKTIRVANLLPALAVAVAYALLGL